LFSLVRKVIPNEFGEVDKHEIKRIIECTELIFIFTIVWSFGGNLDEEGRKTFNLDLVKIVKEVNEKNQDGKELPEIDEGRSY